MNIIISIFKKLRDFLNPLNSKGDKWIWAIMIALMLVSIIWVYSSAFMLAYRSSDAQPEYYLVRHSIFWGIALFCMAVIQKIPIRKIAKFAWMPILFATLLMLVTALFAQEVNGAQRWLYFWGTSFQPSDFAKLALVSYLAYILTIRQNELETRSTFLLLFIPTVVLCGLVFLDNLSTSVLLGLVAFTIMCVGGVGKKYLVAWAASTVSLGVGFFFFLMKAPEQFLVIGRFQTWKNRILQFSDSSSIGFQAQEATNAILHGGFRGAGIGGGIHKNHLPHPYSDYIYAVIIEESGLLLGGLLIPFLFICLFIRTAIAFRDCENLFGSLLALGLGISICFQAFMHMAVNVGLGPVTGIPLPFVSWGGTSLIFSGISMGFILSATNKPEKIVKPIRKTRKNINPRIAVS